MRRKKDWRAMVARFKELKKERPYDSNMALYTVVGAEFGANPDYIRKKMTESHSVLVNRSGTAERNERIRREFAEEVSKHPEKSRREIRDSIGARFGIHGGTVFRIVRPI